MLLMNYLEISKKNKLAFVFILLVNFLFSSNSNSENLSKYLLNYPNLDDPDGEVIFNNEYANLIFILRKRTKNFKDEMKFNQIILNTYFSSMKVKSRIKKLNNKFHKEANNMNIQKPIFRKQKRIYKDI